MITVRKKPHPGIYIGRGSALGNPFDHKGSTHPQVKWRVRSREEAISSYKAWLMINLKEPHLRERHPNIYRAINQLIVAHKRGEDINLVCYCAPLPCHGDVIKEIVENAEETFD